MFFSCYCTVIARKVVNQSTVMLSLRGIEKKCPEMAPKLKLLWVCGARRSFGPGWAQLNTRGLLLCLIYMKRATCSCIHNLVQSFSVFKIC